MRNIRGVLCLCAAYLALGCGCSLIGIRPTPELDAATNERRCGSFGWLLADAAAAGAVLALNAWAAGMAEGTNGYNGCDTNPAVCRHADRDTGYVLAAVFAASALYGAVATGTCNAQLPSRPRQDSPAPK